VLRGARAALGGRPDLLIEVHVGCGLEEFGGSVDALLALVPREGYDLFVAAGVRDGVAVDAGEFHPYRPGDAVLAHRFFLAAVGRA
jgi:hypothetical protein